MKRNSKFSLSRLPQFFKQIFGLTLFLILSCAHKSKQTNSVPSDSNLSGTVVHVSDGDTYDVLFTDSTKQRVRMAYIDAPERGQPFWKVARQLIKDSLLGKKVTLTKLPIKDRNGRWICESKTEFGTDISKLILTSGLAWVYKDYRNDKDWMLLEETAKKEKRGMWVENNLIEPWLFRKNKRELPSE